MYIDKFILFKHPVLYSKLINYKSLGEDPKYSYFKSLLPKYL